MNKKLSSININSEFFLKLSYNLIRVIKIQIHINYLHY